MSARILNCTIAEYHADPCDTPSLSSSVARELVTRSPEHAYELHAKLGGKRRASDAKDTGSILHELLLGKGSGYVVVPHKDFKTDAAKRLRDGAIAVGRVPILKEDIDDAEIAAEEIRDRLLSRHGVDFTRGRCEVPIEWSQRLDTGDSVLCRSLIDHVDGALIDDLKTTRCASPEHVQSVIYEYGYDIQGIAYERALAALFPELAGRTRVRFVFAETEPPYGTCTYELNGEFRKIGTARWERACASWAHWVKQPPPWPGYPTSTVRLGPPPWVRAKEERIAAEAAQ